MRSDPLALEALEGIGRHAARLEATPDGRLVKYRHVNGGWQRWLTYSPGFGWLRHVVCYRSPSPHGCIRYARPKH